jgi:hypothetical protein
MYITYHKEIERPNHVNNKISHDVLSTELKKFIIEKDAEQQSYFFNDNGFYFFIYLDNGDRIDVELNSF